MNYFGRSVLAGIVATVVMTVFMMVAALMGMPKMSPPEMLASGMDTSVVIGWIMHFMIGIIFALIYMYVVSDMLKKIDNVWLKGALFGVIAFIIAQIAMFLMKQMMEMPEPDGSMIVMAIGSFVGHIVFGVVVALIVKK